jgi:ABC-type antimicrobial peptide transport system permease subunit
MLGIYGVLSYSVVTRKQEIGVRMALGATRAKVYALTFAEASVPVFAGVSVGLAGSVLAPAVQYKQCCMGLRQPIRQSF